MEKIYKKALAKILNCVSNLIFLDARSAKHYIFSHSKLTVNLSLIIIFSLTGLLTQAQNKSTGITIPAVQTGGITYGSGSAATYIVTLTSDGASPDGLADLSVNWTAATPAGVTISFSPGTPVTIPTGSTTQDVTLTLTSATTTPAGNYAFTVLANNNPVVVGDPQTSPASSFVVNKATVDIVADPQNKIYGTTLALGTSLFTPVGLQNGETIGSVTLTSTGSVNTAAVGSYAIIPSAVTGGTFDPANYIITYNNTGNLTVNTAALTITADPQNKTYGTTLALGTTLFTPVGLQNGETIGSVIFTSAGAINTANVGSYPIVPSAATGGTFVAANYTITYTNGTLTVNAAALNITASAQSKTYGTTLALGTTLFTSTGLQNGQTIGGVTLTSAGAINTANVGSYPIVPSAATGGTFVAANYTITYTNGTLTVNATALNITASAQSKTYGTTLALGTTLFTSTGLQNGQTIGGVTLTSAGAINTANVGSYPIVPSAATGGTFVAANYTITYTNGTLTVNAAALNITASAQSKTYGTTLALGTTLFTSTALQNGETIGSVTLTSAGAINTANVGSYPIVPSAATGGTFVAANYTITYTNGTLTVNAAALNITAGAQSKTYGTTLALGTTLFTSTGLQNGQTIGGVTLTSAGAINTANVGSYPIVPSAATGGTFVAANYTITYTNGTLTVNNAALNITASAQSKTYGTTLALGSTLFTSTGLQNGETIGSVTLTSAGAINTANVGSYPIVPSAATGGTFVAANYTITYTNGTLTVNAAALNITASAQSKTYGTTLALGSTLFTSTGLQNGQTIGGVTLTSAGAVNTANVGSYPIVPSAATGGTFVAANYNITYTNGTLTVNNAALNITASAQSKTYGTTLALGSTLFTSTGLQNGETIGSVTLTSAGAINTANVGSYPIVPSAATGGTFVAANYTITYTNGTLTVNAAALNITASAQSKTYGTTLALGTTLFTSTGLQNGQTIGGVTLTSAGAVNTANVGSYPIVPSAATGGTFVAANYTITYTNGTLTVNAAALNITASAQSKTYGTTLALGSTLFTSTGLQNGQTIGGVTLTSAGAVNTANVGSYPIVPSAATGGTFVAANYTITYTNGTLTVNAAALNITASAQSKTYGTTLALGSTLFTSSGLQNGETIGSVTLTSAGAINTANVGSYPIVPSAATGGTFVAANYTITYTNGTLTVTKASTTIAVTSNNNPACLGSSITFTGTVTSTPASITGQIQFFDGATSLATVTVSGNAATFSTSALTAGSHNITTQYLGDANFNVSTSPTLTQIVDAAVNLGTISNGNTTICSGGDPVNITFSTVPSGGAGTFNYQWYYQDGTPACPSGTSVTGWTLISGATSGSYDPPAGLTNSRTYAVQVDPTGSPDCGVATWANSCRKITVLAAVDFGTVTSGDETICSGDDPNTITLASQPSGGSGNFTFRWYYKDGIVGCPAGTITTGWNIISGGSGNNNTYNIPGGLTVSRTYALFVTPEACGVATWANGCRKVTVLPALDFGTLASGDQTLCSGGDPGNIIFSNVPSGGTGTFNYQWYYKDGIATCPSGTSTAGWTLISLATSNSYDPPTGLTNSRTYAVQVDPTGSPDCSSPTWANTCRKVTVNAAVNFGTITNGDQTICSAGDPGNITFSTTPSGGAGTFTYQWYYQDGIATCPSGTSIAGWTLIPGATSSNYDPPAGLTGSRTYAVQADPTGTPDCGVATWANSCRKVIVNAVVDFGTLSNGDQTLCSGGDPANITFSTTPSGGAGTFSYQWYFQNGIVSCPSGTSIAGWTLITGATSNSYDPPTGLAGSRTYAVQVDPTGSPDCGPATWANNCRKITVQAVVDFGTLASGDQTICYSGDPNNITFSTVSSGGAGTFNYQWYYQDGIVICPSGTSLTGWTLISGAISNSYDPPAGLIGSRTYAVQVDPTGSPDCGVPTWANSCRKVTVRPIIDLGTIANGDQTICSGDDPNNIIFSVAPSGGAGTFNYFWYFQDGIVPCPTGTSTVGWTLITGVNTNSYDPPAGLIASRTYAVRVDATGSPDCGVATWANNCRKVTVNALPVVSITGPNPICAGFTTTLSPTLGGTWVSNNTSVATVNSTTGVVTGVAAVTGIATFTFTLTSTGCINTTPPLTVNALPAVAPITDGAASICVNGITNFNDATTGGTWSITPGTGTASIDNTGLVTGLSAGTVTVVYTYSNGTCTNSVSAPLTIDALPPISPVAGGSLTVCENAMTPAFTDATSGGTWSIINGTGSASITSGGIVTGITAGSVTVLYTTANGTCSNEAAKSLTVKPLPTVAAISGGVASICENAITPAFTDATSGGTWSVINGTGSASISVGGAVTPISPGTVTVAYTVTGGGCSNTATKPLTINAIPVIAPIAGGASSVCLNSSTVAFTDGTGGGIWSITNGTGTASITAGGVVTGLSVGTITVVYTVTSGSCSDFVMAPLTVNALPVAGAITGASSVCVGSTINLTSNATGAGSLTYIWASSNALFATVSNTGVVSGVASGIPGITYTVTDGNGCSSISAVHPVNVNARPLANITLANTAICNGSSINITGTVTASGAWTLTLSNGAITAGTGTGTFSVSITPVANTTYTITSLSDVNCNSIAGDLTGSVTITVNNPVVINTQPSDVTVCATLPADLTVSASGSGVTYQWYKGTAPGGTIVTNTSNISGATSFDLHFIQASSTDDADYYVVISGLNPCSPKTSGPAHLTVSTTIIISGQPASQTICSGSNVTFSVTATTAVGPLVYQWRKNGTDIPGAILTSYTITGATAADAGNYDVKITGIGGCTTAFSTIAILTIDPVSVGGTVSSSAAECSGNNTATLNLTGQTGAVINWESSPDGTTWTTVTPANTTTSLTYTNLTSLTYYRAIVKSGVCLPAPSSAAIITIKPIPNATATPTAQSKCSGNAITTIVLGSAVIGTTFTWTRDNNATVTGILASGSGDISGTLINTTTGSVTVTFTITPTANGCVGAPITATVIVNPIPNAVATPSSQTICSGPITTIVITGNIPLTTYNWTRNNTVSATGIAASGSGDISGSLTNTTNALVTVTFTIIPTINGCPGTAITATVAVKPTPTISATNTNQTLCSPATIASITISNPNSVPGTAFSWTRDNTTGNLTGIAASGSSNPITGTLTNTTSNQQVTVFTLIATASGCSSSTIATVNVNPRPAMTSTNATRICNSSTVSILLTSNVPSTYTWIAANNANTTGESTTTQTTSTLSNTLVNTSPVPFFTGLTPRQDVLYTVTPTSTAALGSCPGTQQIVTVTVNPNYNISFYEYPTDDNNFTICDGELVGGGGQNDMDLIEGQYAGSILLWQYSIGSNTGPWSTTPGPHVNGQINGIHDTLPDPPSIFSPQGSYYFRLLVDGCASDIISLIKTSTLTIDAGPDNTVCESGTPAPITLSGSAVNGTSTTTRGGTWSITSLNPANGPFVGILSNASFITSASGGIPNVTYTPPSNYSGTVTLTLTSNDPDGNGDCSPITETRLINVSQAPIISNASAMSICNGSGTNINLTSVIPSTFTWTISNITGGITGASGGSGPTINQVLNNPSTTTTGTVQYNVTPTPNSATTCAAVTASIVVTVTPSPAINLIKAPATNICQGSSATLTATNSGGTLNGILSGSNFTPQQIQSVGISTITSNITLPAGTITAASGITLTVNLNHTWVGDLTATLISPSCGSSIIFNRPGGNNNGDDLAGNYTFTSTSVITFPANTNPVTPQTYKATFTGITFPCANAAGDWILKITDNGTTDGGFLNNWTLTINTNGKYTSVFNGPASIGAVIYSGGATQPTATAIVTPPAGSNNYSVTTTDANGCTGTSAPIAVIVNPILTLTGAATSAVCAGSPATINLTGLVANSTSVITYKIGSGATQTVSVTAVGTTGTFNTGNLTFANNGQALLISNIAYSVAPTCPQPLNVSVSLVVNPTPTISGATQPPVCDGSSAQINLTGLVANSTSTITYTIGGGPVQTVTGVVATGTNGSFNTIPLTFANNGQTLQITGITITSATPNCPQTFTQNVTLNVKVIPVLSSTLAPPPVCSGSTFTYAPASATSGATFTWTRAAVGGITPATSSGTGTVAEVLTNTTSSPINVTYKYTTSANSCNNAPGENVVVSVNPSPTIATASQTAASCAGSGATINLTGLLPGTTSTIYYVINNVAQTPVTGVIANGSGVASFVSASLTLANDGQILKITGISNTLFTPSCIKSVTVIALLSVTPVPTLTGASQASGVCVSGPATVNLTGLVAGSLNNTINYTINGVAQPVVTGIDADVSGNSSFNTSILTSANNGQTLIITGITSGACSKSFSQSFVLSVGSSYVWKGVNNDWFDIQNWCGGVPTITSDVLIPGSLLNYPILTTGIGSTHDITIQSTASVTITGTTLQIAGNITNNGNFDVTNGALEFNGAGSQTIPAGAFANNKIKDLIITNNVSLGGQDSLTGNLSFGGSGKTFTTNGNLTLKSTAAGTANVGQILNGNSINGDVWVERYISAKRAWRFLSVPTNTTQTFHQAWQENMAQSSTTQTTPAGYGTQITNHVTPTPLPGGNGFDYDSPDGPSVKKFDITATGIYAPYKSINGTGDVMATNEGIMTFVRGDRRSAGLGATPYSTILRTNGSLNTGIQSIMTAPANQFISIGNPYASVLDMNNIYTGNTTNLEQFFYLWDPYGTGPTNIGFGSFQTFFRSSDGKYHPTTPNGSYLADPYNYIQSGQAFFMRSLIASGGSITLTEQAKANVPFSSPLVFRPEAATTQPIFHSRLLAINTNADADIVDGVVNIFGDEFSNSVDDLDAIKISNFGENLGIKNGDKILVVERRQTINKEDTIHINIRKMKAKSYRFEFIGEDFNPALTAFLEDSYLNNRTPINVNGTTPYDFNVINVPGSYNPERFRIVFTKAFGGPLPITFTTVKAYQKSEDIAVEWKVENEKNIKRYEIEKSKDGLHFTTSSTLAATGNNGNSANYQWLDVRPVTGNNYYRIKSTDINGEVKYTNIVKVVVGSGRSQITVYPNPVKDGNINVQFSSQPQGRYGLRLMNKLGQVIMVKEIERQEGSSTENLKVKLLSHEAYNLEITKPDKSLVNINVLY